MRRAHFGRRFQRFAVGLALLQIADLVQLALQLLDLLDSRLLIKRLAADRRAVVDRKRVGRLRVLLGLLALGLRRRLPLRLELGQRLLLGVHAAVFVADRRVHRVLGVAGQLGRRAQLGALRLRVALRALLRGAAQRRRHARHATSIGLIAPSRRNIGASFAAAKDTKQNDNCKREPRGAPAASSNGFAGRIG